MRTQILIKKLQSRYDRNIPLVKNKRKRNKPNNPWITKGILKSIRTRNRLYKLHLRKPTDINLETYKKYRNKLTKIIRTSRKLYFSHKLKQVSSNMYATWKIIKEVMGTKKDVLPKDDLTINDDIIEDSNNYAHRFNSFFTRIGPQLTHKIDTPIHTHYTDFLSNRVENSLFLGPTNPNEIISITQSLSMSNAQGYDRISTSLLKQIIHVIVDPLTHIFNHSLQQGVFPDLFKIAKVNPIFKKGDSHEISNIVLFLCFPVFQKF